LSYENLSKYRPDLIYVNVLGDRSGGTAVDYTVNCAVGFTEATGEPGNENPTNYLLPAWDNITGQMAAVAMLAAERHRRQTGEGQLVKLALKDVALATAGHLGNISEVMINNDDRQKSGNYLYGGFGRDFISKDGRRFMIVGLTRRQWQVIVEATGIGDQVEKLGSELGVDLNLEGERFKAREKLAKLIEPWFAENDSPSVKQKMEKGGACFGPYQTFREMVEQDADCSVGNPLFSLLDQPGIGEYLVPASPIMFGKSPNVPAMTAPRLGEHTDQILAEDLKLPSHEIADLHDRKIVA
jgi:2-methylfumaryl-CoA isomerase